MMRSALVLGFLLLSGCMSSPQGEATAVAPQSMSRTEIAQVWTKVEKIAVALCEKENHGKASNQCDFSLEFAQSGTSLPNAYSKMDLDGRSQIGINTAMQRQLQNADEVAFVLTHEAGHTVAHHNAPLGQRSLAGVLQVAQKGSKYMELEADAIGAIIAASAGFDPVRGSEILKRVHNAPGSTTHPDMAKRLDLVKRTASTLSQGISINLQ